jgi:enoyl-CoA hydratase/carnithine racemase
MKTERLSLTSSGDVLNLRLESPPENRTDTLFFKELAQMLSYIEHTPDVRGLIISSRGRHFSSGADIAELLELLAVSGKGGNSPLNSHSMDLFNGLRRKPFPVVCAIQGCCLGSGLELALACHYRIATGNALFGLPEVGYGLMPGCGGTVYLPGLIGTGKSIDFILGSHNLLAEDALRIGLIDMVVKKDELLGTARKFITCKTARPPL